MFKERCTQEVIERLPARPGLLETTDVPCAADSDAPLGLGFEWPEKVWKLSIDGGKTGLTIKFDGEFFRCLFYSEEDALGFLAMCVKNWPHRISGGYDAMASDFERELQDARDNGWLISGRDRNCGLSMHIPTQLDPIEVFYVR
jgi:hypothetical protein